MATFYPRKQTVIIFVVCVLAVGSVAYYTSSYNKNAYSAAENSAAALIAATAMNATSSEIDSAAFADWRKQFVGAVKTPTGKTATSSKEKLTQTDNFSRDFFTKYMELKQANLLSNQDIVNQTAQDLVDSHIDDSPSKIYTITNLRITNATDKNGLASFSSAVGKAIGTYYASTNESNIVESYLADSNATVLKKLDPIILSYKKTIASLLDIPVPKNVSIKYLGLINSFNTLEFAAEDLRASDTDTVRGLAGVSAHANGQIQLISALTDLQDALQTSDVEFSFNQNAMNSLLN